MLEEINLKKRPGQPLYLQIVEGIKDNITKGLLRDGEKLVSIRQLAKALNVSKTTIEMSYQILVAEGWLESREKVGYQICGLKSEKQPEKSPIKNMKTKKNYIYDFSTYYLDEKYFDKKNWKRHLNYVLKDEKNLNRYGENQGELELRESIASYIKEYRGVHARPEEIIIGAGFQSLLQLLLPNIKDIYNQVIFNQEGFPSGEYIFQQFGYDIGHFSKEAENNYHDTLLYINSDNSFLDSYKKKVEFLKLAYKRNILIIEDDYNGEFRSGKRPVPALKSLDTFDKIIYFGAFSSILAPSIRISYLIVPEPYLTQIRENISYYNQTSSSIEQLALAKFINNGFLAKSVRSMRKGYQKKRELLIKALDKYFSGSYMIRDTNSTVEMKISFSFPITTLHIATWEKNGVKLKSTGESNSFTLIFAGISSEKIEQGIKIMSSSCGFI